MSREEIARQRRTLANAKRIVLAFVDVILIPMTCVYISLAAQHGKVINAHPAALKTPFPAFNYTIATATWALAIPRAVYCFSTLLAVWTVPEWMISIMWLGNLAFEIPLAILCNSAYARQITMAFLDLDPDYRSCVFGTGDYFEDRYNIYQRFFVSYSSVTSISPSAACSEFTKEGGLLRVSLILSWFMLYIPLTVIIVITMFNVDKPSWFHFISIVTGLHYDTEDRANRLKTREDQRRMRLQLEQTVGNDNNDDANKKKKESWIARILASMPKMSLPKVSLPKLKMPSFKRGASPKSSNASTLVGSDDVEVKFVDEKAKLDV